MINLISNLTAELSFKIYRTEPSTTIWTAGSRDPAHTRGVYPAKDNSSVGTQRVK